MTLLEILQRGRARIAHGWTQGTYARSFSGRPTLPSDTNAEVLALYDAAIAAAQAEVLALYDAAIAAAQEAT